MIAIFDEAGWCRDAVFHDKYTKLESGYNGLPIDKMMMRDS